MEGRGTYVPSTYLYVPLAGQLWASQRHSSPSMNPA